jgi:uncharacterized protein YheU (UPF0270 family)
MKSIKAYCNTADSRRFISASKVNPFDSIHSNSTRNNVLESGRDHPQRERTHSRKVRRIKDLLNVGNAQMVQFKSIVSTGNRNDAIALATNIPV